MTTATTTPAAPAAPGDAHRAVDHLGVDQETRRHVLAALQAARAHRTVDAVNRLLHISRVDQPRLGALLGPAHHTALTAAFARSRHLSRPERQAFTAALTALAAHTGAVASLTARIPAPPGHPGGPLLSVVLAARCPICGGPRGPIRDTATTPEHERRPLDAIAWTNPCGHLDTPAQLLAEAGH